jgi:NADH-quinone oxidoreductase subunit F
MTRTIERLEAGQGTEEDLDKLNDIGNNIVGRSFCALGDAAPAPIMSAILHFRDEIMAHQKNGGCWFDPKASTAWAGN